MLYTYIITCALFSAVPLSSGTPCIQMDCRSASSYVQCIVKGAQSIVSLRLITKELRSPCNYLFSYGYRDNYIWVDKGCKATFEVCSVYPVTTNATLVLPGTTTSTVSTLQPTIPSTWATTLTPRSKTLVSSRYMTKHLAGTIVSATSIRSLKAWSSKSTARMPPMTSIYEFTFETISTTTTTMNVHKHSASTTRKLRPSSNLKTTTTTLLTTTSAMSSAASIQSIIPATSTSETLSTTSLLVTVKTVSGAFRNNNETESSSKANTFIAAAIISGLLLITLVGGCVAFVSLRTACMKVSPSADTAN